MLQSGMGRRRISERPNARQAVNRLHSPPCPRATLHAARLAGHRGSRVPASTDHHAHGRRACRHDRNRRRLWRAPTRTARARWTGARHVARHRTLQRGAHIRHALRHRRDFCGARRARDEDRRDVRPRRMAAAWARSRPSKWRRAKPNAGTSRLETLSRFDSGCFSTSAASARARRPRPPQWPASASHRLPEVCRRVPQARRNRLQFSHPRAQCRASLALTLSFAATPARA